MRLWNWLRCRVNRPAWEFLTPTYKREDFADDDTTVHRLCLSCEGLVQHGKHWDIFAGI